jgi:branched-subunit amino acid transport protein AzlD
MASEIVYMLGIVAVGFLVNFGLRALPFILFAGRNRTSPTWVTGLGHFISPVIIGGLIVYSYSGLEWKTPWPYLAGVLTVALHLWKGNSLASIVAGTVAYMCLLKCG